MTLARGAKGGRRSAHRSIAGFSELDGVLVAMSDSHVDERIACLGTAS
jgi:hypothetical protein